MGRYDKVKIGDRVRITRGAMKKREGIVGDFNNPDPPPQNCWFAYGFDKDYYIPILIDDNNNGFVFSPYFLVRVDQVEIVDYNHKPVPDHTISTEIFCACSSPNVVRRTVALCGIGKEYKYCLNCRKEVR